MLILLFVPFIAFAFYCYSLYLENKRTIPTKKECQKFEIIKISIENSEIWNLSYLVQYKKNKKMILFSETLEDSLGYTGDFVKNFSSYNEAFEKAKELSEKACSLNVENYSISFK